MTKQFWDEVGAPAWVAEQAALDRQLSAHNDVLLARAALAAGSHVVDAGCGAGALTLELARAVGPDGRVVGVDFSAQMLELARRRAAQSASCVEFVEADLETWDGPGSAVHAVVSRLGLTASPALLATVRRVLRPGGQLTATVFRDVGVNEWMLLPTLAVAGVLPVELPAPSPTGPFCLADQDTTTELLVAAGFEQVELAPLDYEVQMTGPGGGGVDVVLAVGPAARALRAADETGRAAARAAVEQALAPHDHGTGARLRAGAWLITARA